jgi:hypothetical protein
MTRLYPGVPATGATPANPPGTLTGADPSRTRDMITTGKCHALTPQAGQMHRISDPGDLPGRTA